MKNYSATSIPEATATSLDKGPLQRDVVRDGYYYVLYTDEGPVERYPGRDGRNLTRREIHRFKSGLDMVRWLEETKRLENRSDSKILYVSEMYEHFRSNRPDHGIAAEEARVIEWRLDMGEDA